MTQRRLAFFLVLALLVQALLPFAATYHVAERNTSIFGDKVLLCTAEGFRWVSWEELQQQETAPESHGQYQCGACYLAAHNTSADAKAVTLDASAPPPTLRWLPSYAHAALSGAILRVHDQPRAPPIQAVIPA